MLIVMRSPLVGNEVERQIESLTGGDWTADRAYIGLDGNLIVENLALNASGVPGPSARVLGAERAIAEIDWSGLPLIRWLSGSTSTTPRVTALRLFKPVFRLAQSMDDGGMNLSGLTPAAGNGVSAGLPQFDVIDGRIEFAEYSPRAGTYFLLNTLPVAGSFMPASHTAGGAKQPVYTIRLQEIGRPPGARGETRGMILDGRIDLSTNDATLRLFNVSLDAWPPESVPSAMRDIWRRLNIEGAVSQAIFRYTLDAGITADITVDDVSMFALVPAKGPNDPDATLSLRGVHGQIVISASGIHADLEGLLEDQAGPSRVQLDTYGLDLECALRCEIESKHINLRRDPAFLPYVPRTVREYLDRFGGPTADVDARVVILRGDPVDVKAAEFEVPEGRLEFRGGQAAFHKFPYPFHDMSGIVDFDDQSIRIQHIRGTGPTGARLSAAGTITPLTDDAAVDLTIGVQGAPVDDHLLEAMQPSYRRLMDMLFSRRGHESLIAAGLIDNTIDPVEAEKVQTVVPEKPPPPPFAFGGRAAIGIKILRPPGEDVEWSTDIDVSFDRAGIVPEPFPFPIVARNVQLKIDDDGAEFVDGQFTGLRGGRAELRASVRFAESPGAPMQPDVQILAYDVPVDDLLLNAVPGDEATDRSGQTPSADEILSRLALQGTVDCRATIVAREESEIIPLPVGVAGPPSPLDVDWTVAVNLDDVNATPREGLVGGTRGGPRVCLRELTGEVEVSPKHVRIERLRAQLGRFETGRSDAGALESEPAGLFDIKLFASTVPDLSTGRPPTLEAGIVLENLELADPIEQAIAVFDLDAAATIADLRAARCPEGVVNARIDLKREQGGPIDVGVSMAPGAVVRVEALGGTVEAAGIIGRFSITAQAGGDSVDQVRFEGLQTRIAYNAEPSGTITLDGGFAVGIESLRPAAPADLRCAIGGWRLESTLLAALVDRFAPEDARARFAELSPAGVFDGQLELRDQGPAGGVRYAGRLRPRDLGLTIDDKPLRFDSVSGRLLFEVVAGAPAPPTGVKRPLVQGHLDEMALTTEEWAISLDGPWSVAESTGDGGSAITADLRLGVRAEGLPESLAELLPQRVLRARESAGVRFNGPIELFDATLSLRPSGDPSAPPIRFAGTVRFSGLFADFGAELADARGTARISLEPAGVSSHDSEDPPLNANIGLALDACELGSIALMNLESQIEVSHDGRINVSRTTATCHGGQVYATVRAEPLAADRPDGGERIRFDVDAIMSGVEFGPLLEDVRRAARGLEPPEGDADADQIPPIAGDATRGLVDARISLTGDSNDPRSRRGRGAIRISRGDVVRLPLILQLVQMSNLLVPTDDRLEYLQTSFYIDGPAAVFDEITLLSRSVSIVGTGTILWPNYELDMRFNSRSRSRIPVLTDLFEALRDELASTTVTGTLADPVIRPEPLTATRRLLGDVAQRDRSAADRIASDTRRAEAAARRELRRLNESSVAVPPDSTPPANP